MRKPDPVGSRPSAHHPEHAAEARAGAGLVYLHRIDVDRLLEKAGHDYLLVLSRGPDGAYRGRTLRYTPVVKSKKGGVTIRVDAGPDGMKATADGRIVWAVPEAFPQDQVQVILTVSDTGGQQTFHTFRLRVREKGQAP